MNLFLNTELTQARLQVRDFELRTENLDDDLKDLRALISKLEVQLHVEQTELDSVMGEL